ncbi:MAG: GDP-mannose 4,6-dehydratase, partial [Negativicutes bacterium]|nr:GDP-mannose 4,6-dehydratase [Negativicutes bacterium]
MLRALVTGGAGFVGSNFVAAWTSDRCREAVVYDNFSRGRQEFLAPLAGRGNVKVITGDILDGERLAGAM